MSPESSHFVLQTLVALRPDLSYQTIGQTVNAVATEDGFAESGYSSHEAWLYAVAKKRLPDSEPIPDSITSEIARMTAITQNKTHCRRCGKPSSGYLCSEHRKNSGVTTAEIKSYVSTHPEAPWTEIVHGVMLARERHNQRRLHRISSLQQSLAVNKRRLTRCRNQVRLLVDKQDVTELKIREIIAELSTLEQITTKS